MLLAGSGYTIENIKAIIKPGFFKQILQSLDRGNSAFGWQFDNNWRRGGGGE